MNYKEESELYSKVPKDLQKIASLVKLMESSFRIPFTNRTFGLEPLIGMIPILGDASGFLISAGIMLVLLRNNASGEVIAKMFGNMLIDMLLAVMPFLGNIIDFFFKTNQRNLTLALEHYQQGKHQGSASKILFPVFIGLFIAFVILLTAMVFLTYFIFNIIKDLL